MKDDDKSVGVATEPESKELKTDKKTENFFTKPTSGNHLQQAVNRVLTGNLDEIVKQALQQALQKALEPIVTQAIEKALSPAMSQSIEPATNSLPDSVTPRNNGSIMPDGGHHSISPGHASICPDNARSSNGPCRSEAKKLPS